MNNIVIELHPEDRARLDAIIAGLSKLQPVCDTCVEHVVHMFEGAPQTAKPDFLDKQLNLPQTPVADPAPAKDPEPTQDPTPAAPNLAEFQKVVTERCAASPAVKAKVRELVNRYAPSVSEIPEDKRNEFLALLATV